MTVQLANLPGFTKQQVLRKRHCGKPEDSDKKKIRWRQEGEVFPTTLNWFTIVYWPNHTVAWQYTFCESNESSWKNLPLTSQPMGLPWSWCKKWSEKNILSRNNKRRVEKYKTASRLVLFKRFQLWICTAWPTIPFNFTQGAVIKKCRTCPLRVW